MVGDCPGHSMFIHTPSIPSDLASVPDVLFLHFGKHFIFFKMLCFLFFCLFFGCTMGQVGP